MPKKTKKQIRLEAAAAAAEAYKRDEFAKMSKIEQFFRSILDYDRDSVIRLLADTRVDPTANDDWAYDWYKDADDIEMLQWLYYSRHQDELTESLMHMKLTMNQEPFLNDAAGDDDFHHQNFTRNELHLPKISREDYDDIAKKRKGLALRSGRALTESWWFGLDNHSEMHDCFLQHIRAYDKYNRETEEPLDPYTWYHRHRPIPMVKDEFESLFRSPPNLITSLFHDECAVCLGTESSGSYVFLLPCRHRFHYACIDQAMQSTRASCPICRVNTLYLLHESCLISK